MKKIILFLAVVFSVKMAAQPAGWLYNQMITVNNPNAQAAVNYQLKLTINTQSLIALGKMTATGSDLRFGGTCSGTAFFNYWIESGINTPTTAVWVKIPLIAANTSSLIFMFFGNPLALPVSAVQGTFRGPNSATDSVTGGTSGGLLVCQRGFRFQPNQNLLITHFGKNEPTGSTRFVTLFNYASQAILSQTQVAGPAATYSYGPISSPIWLTSGTQYVLQIYGLATDGYYFGASSQIGQHLTYIDMQYSNGGTQNTFPTSTLANFHYGYGDFWYYITNTLVTVPSYTLGGSLVSITTTSNYLCSGASATLTTDATGTYSWSTGSSNSLIVVSPIVTTSYSVTQTNTIGCNSIAVITLTVNTGPPSLSVTVSSPTICPTNTVALTGSGALSYSWSGGISNGVPFAPLTTTSYILSGMNGCGTSTMVATVTVTSLPVIGLANPNIVCAGSTTSLSAGGATTYTWQPGNLVGANVIVSPQANTNYTVLGAFGNCFGINTVSVATNPNPTITATASQSINVCVGTSVTLTATGALGYTWQPGGLTGASIVVTPTSPIAYVVTGTNNFNCSSNTSQVVITSQSPTVTAFTSNSLICLGGSATLSASGADAYAWNTGALTAVTVVNPIISTVYSVVGTNTTSGCSNTQTLSVSVFVATLSVSAPTAVCLGASVTLNASGATSYTWSNGSNSNSIFVGPLVTTNYLVNGISNFGNMSCASSGSTTVTVNPIPVVAAVCTRTNICKFEFASITATGASTYLWSNTSTNTVLSVNPIVTTNYSVTGTDANGCVNTATIQIKVSLCTGVGEMNNQNASGILIFPNPSNGDFNVKAEHALELNLVNELGQTIQTISLTAENNYQSTIKGIANGIYFVVGKYKQETISQKVIIQ